MEGKGREGFDSAETGLPQHPLEAILRKTYPKRGPHFHFLLFEIYNTNPPSRCENSLYLFEKKVPILQFMNHIDKKNKIDALIA
jgi:hypothetical protein